MALTYPVGFFRSSAASPPTATYITTGYDSVQRTTYTFTVDCGSYDEIVVVCMATGVGAKTLSSGNVGANSCTIDETTSDAFPVGIMRATNPGGSQTVTIVWSGDCGRMGFSAYGLDDRTSAVVVADRDYTESSNALSVSLTATGPLAMIAGSVNGTSELTATWTGGITAVTEDADAEIGTSNRTYTSGHENTTSSYSSTAVTVTYSGSMTSGGLAAVIYT